jgi:hypothetical protein
MQKNHITRTGLPGGNGRYKHLHAHASHLNDQTVSLGSNNFAL